MTEKNNSYLASTMMLSINLEHEVNGNSRSVWGLPLENRIR